jgi:hypothetical protein
MRKIFIFFVLALCYFLNAQSQTLEDFRSKVSGPSNWNDFNACKRYDGTTWVAAVSGRLPTATSSTEIQAAHSIVSVTCPSSGNVVTHLLNMGVSVSDLKS